MFTTFITSSLFWQFVALNFVNVLINTARSLVTVKGGKWIASLMNSICYGYYTIIIVITALYEIPLPLKVIAVAIVNFIGVFCIKLGEEKIQKEKLWVYNIIGINTETEEKIRTFLDNTSVKYYSEELDNNYWTMTIFSETQKESTLINSILNNYSVKFYAVETMEKNRN